MRLGTPSELSQGLNVKDNTVTLPEENIKALLLPQSGTKIPKQSTESTLPENTEKRDKRMSA